jgi:hypothetical protein
MKSVYGNQQGIFYPVTAKFYYDLQAKSRSFWGNERKSRQMSTHVTKRVAPLYESMTMTKVTGTAIGYLSMW